MLATLFGDWHGNGRYATHALAEAQRRTPTARLIHVGDMGLWVGSDAAAYLAEVDAVTEQDLFVIPGNHECWPALQIGSELGFTGVDSDGFLYTPLYPRIRVCPRVNVWEWDGAVFAALAGANSIDFQLRQEGRSWWPEESPTDEHVDQLVELCQLRSKSALLCPVE